MLTPKTQALLYAIRKKIDNHWFVCIKDLPSKYQTAEYIKRLQYLVEQGYLDIFNASTYNDVQHIESITLTYKGWVFFEEQRYSLIIRILTSVLVPVVVSILTTKLTTLIL